MVGTGARADDRVEIGARPIPQEPLYIIANLGMSGNFGYVDIANIVFPAIMRIDWIRVYQRADEPNTGCSLGSFKDIQLDGCVYLPIVR